jgi:hypothetical protein
MNEISVPPSAEENIEPLRMTNIQVKRSCPFIERQDLFVYHNQI